MSGAAGSDGVSGAAASRRQLVAIGAGNAMEWYDWNVYATFSAFFASQFFLGGSASSEVLKALAVFAVGFGARPFGGFLFGWLADRRGRKPAMALSVALAAGGSLVIGLTPSAHRIGIAAPILLVLARLAQGLAHGGELPAAQTYLSEMAPRERRGLWSSLIYVSGSIGMLCATVLGAVLALVLDHAQLVAYGWRVAFLLGGVFGLFALYMRTRMDESEVFSEATGPGPRAGAAPGIWRRVLAHPGPLLRVLGLTVGLTVVYYVWAVGAPAYAISQWRTGASGALWAGSLATVVFILVLPVWGMLADRVGRRPVMLAGGVVLAVLFLPLQSLIRGQSWQLLVAMSVALLLLGSWLSVAPAVFAELFPTGIRAAGLGVPYSVAVALFGGTAPYLQAWFAQHGRPSTFAWYAIALMVISLLTVWFMPETRACDLRGEPGSAPARANA